MVARPDLQAGEQPLTNAPVELPVVVIVGRPNVGKSTLFNAITRSRRSIVGDEPGITRDRIHGEAWHDGRHFLLIDTGGIIQNDAELIPREILKQARVALSRAAQIIFLIDGRTEITGADRDLAKMLRQIGKPVTLAVNKIDSAARENLTHEFHVLGFKRSEEHTSELQSPDHLVCRLLLEKKKHSETTSHEMLLQLYSANRAHIRHHPASTWRRIAPAPE